MILFFAKGEIESDRFVRFCYGHYRDIMASYGRDDLPRSVKIIREDSKKPRFDSDEVFFNLSHSHGVIMLGISHTPIGVDIEKIRPIDFASFKFIDAQDEEEFFEKWTERESYIKMTGEGLKDLKKPIPDDAHFEHFPVWEEYHACVCAEEQSVIAYQIDINAVE